MRNIFKLSFIGVSFLACAACVNSKEVSRGFACIDYDVTSDPKWFYPTNDGYEQKDIRKAKRAKINEADQKIIKYLQDDYNKYPASELFYPKTADSRVRFVHKRISRNYIYYVFSYEINHIVYIYKTCDGKIQKRFKEGIDVILKK